ncbi:MAG TPA: helix-turn-helix domain-containing protein [Nevskia sp.]|jgi:AcrR family transcriptional regulator|nr:helix-turn-helix domain-containing protein [Nevskia sp.]
MSATLAARFAKALADPDASADALTERILDAALEQFQLGGLRRSSMEDVARRAGLSRVTIYRRFPQKDRLVETVLLRECRRLVEDVGAAIKPLRDIGERVEESFVILLRRLHNDPLATRLLALEPEDLAVFMTIKAGPAIALGTEFIAGLIRAAQREGSLPQYEARSVAEVLARMAHSLFLTPQGGTPLGTDRQARAFARGTILPILMRSAAA